MQVMAYALLSAVMSFKPQGQHSTVYVIGLSIAQAGPGKQC